MSFMSQEAEYHRFAVYNEIDLPPPLSPDTDSDDDTHVDKVSNLGLFCIKLDAYLNSVWLRTIQIVLQTFRPMIR